MFVIFRRMLPYVLVLTPFILMASDVRFAGMGKLSLVFEDEFYRINLYDFAGLPAAFLAVPDTQASMMVRGSWLKEVWELDSLTYTALGQAVPPKLIDYTPTEAAAALYAAIPLFDASPTGFVYSSAASRRTSNYYGDKQNPSAWRVYGDYGQLSRTYIGDSAADRIRTPAGSFVYASQISKQLTYGLAGDAFYGSFNSADGDTKATLFPMGLSGGMQYEKDRFTLGLNVEYHYPMVNLTDHSYTESYKGHAAAPVLGAVINLKDLTWINAVDYKWMDLGGRYDTFDIGRLKITGYSARSMAVLDKKPFRAAAIAHYAKRAPTYADDNGNLWYDAVFKNYGIGLGAGILHKKLAIGIEGSGSQVISEDRQLAEVITGRNITIKLGLEYFLIKGFCIRAGYDMEQLDPDVDAAGDLTTGNVITGGGGLYLADGIRLDVAYNYRMLTTELDPDETITDHVIKLFFKYMIKQESDTFRF